MSAPQSRRKTSKIRAILRSTRNKHSSVRHCCRDPKQAAPSAGSDLKPTLGQNPAKPAKRPKSSHRFVTTADAKIPLSVVQVKQEPQDVVSAGFTRHLVRQQPVSVVQNRKNRIQSRFPGQNRGSSQRKSPLATEANPASTPSLEPMPILLRQQGAEAVQLLWTAVRVVDKAGRNPAGFPNAS